MFLITSPFKELAHAEKDQDHFQEPMPVIKESYQFDEFIAAINCGYSSHTTTATRYYFIRHGESLGNKERIYAGQTLDVDLTEQGERDAVRAGLNVKAMQEELGWAFDHVFSSPSLRARRTIEIALAQIASLVREFPSDARLMEKHLGEYDGKPMDEEYRIRTKAWENEIENSSTFWERFNCKHDPSNQQEESICQVFDRVVEFLTEKSCQEEFHGKNVLVGSHGGVLKTLLIAHAAVNLRVILDYHRFEVPNGSLLIVEINEGNMKVIHTEGFKFRAH